MNAPQHITTYEDIASALHCVPSHDRDVWVRMAMAVKSELGEDGIGLWDDWSQGASNYDASAARATWKSIAPHGKVSIASLFSEAFANGWQPSKPYTPITPEDRQRLDAEREAATLEAEQLKAEQRAQAKAKAVKDWTESIPTAHNHAYTLAKGIKPYGAKTISGLLVLPLYANGELVNLQRINSQGEKRFLTGGQVKGAYMPIGKLTKETKEAILCEGWATGCSLHEATGTPVVVAWNAGNLPIIAQRLRDAFPTMELRVCGDNDASGTGQKAAHEAAGVHGLGVWCIPHFTDEHYQAASDSNKTRPNDFNDLHQLAGLAEVKQQTQKIRLLGIAQESQAVQITTKNTPVFGVPQNKEEQEEQEEQNSETRTSSGSACSSFDENLGGTQKAKEEQKRNSCFFVVQGVAGVRAGVYWKEPPNDDGTKEPAKPLWLCSPLHVVAETRDAEQSNWGRLLQWKDNDGHEHTWACPIEILASSDATEFRKELVRNGLTINTNGKARQKLTDYVTTYPPQEGARMRCVTRIGWHGLRYVLPSTVYGCSNGDSVIFQGVDTGDFAQAGVLSEWQQHIAALAVGNSRIAFALSVAFAGVLCDMAGESGGGFHFVGTTSKGKTSTLLDPAASVWGNPDRFAKKWRTTTNGLEALCISRNDGLLILDELAQVAPQEAGGAAYLIANGQAKSRMTKEGSNRPAQTWRTMLLSAGEIDLAQHMADAGKNAKGGQIARLPAIPADAGTNMGALESLHHLPTGQAFADNMKNVCRRYYGTAGTAFLNQLTNPENLSVVRATIKAELRGIENQLPIPSGCAPEVGRVASRFALVAYAGELAASYGVTGWQKGEALSAVKQCFNAWIEDNETGLGSDDKALLQQVTAYMQAHAATRFPPHCSTNEELSRCHHRAGFSRVEGDCAIEYWINTEAFKHDLCKGFSPKAAIAILARAGLLKQGGTETKNGKVVQLNTQKKRIPAMGVTSNFYVIDKSILEGELQEIPTPENPQ